jgi:hypothetical protein
MFRDFQDAVSAERAVEANCKTVARRAVGKEVFMVPGAGR